jgi:SAM-dependent methyltransferase
MSTTTFTSRPSRLARAIEGACRWNFDWCQRIDRRFALSERLGTGYQARYFQECADRIAAMSNGVVLDVGVGRKLAYREFLPPNRTVELVGCDISAEEVSYNQDIDRFVVCDASETLALPDHSVSLVTSHMCLEHLRDTAKFVREMRRVLVPKGTAILFFAGANAPHALLHRLLPHSTTRALLNTLLPWTRLSQGFRAYYDKTSYSAFASLLSEHGFSVEQVWHAYAFRVYLSFFVPAYLVGVAIDWTRHVLNLRDFACAYVFVARAPGVCAS